MAFVPGHPHDLFLSYAHDEADWAASFRTRLERAISIKLGRPVSFWQDGDLRIGQVWRDEIETAIRDTAARGIRPDPLDVWLVVSHVCIECLSIVEQAISAMQSRLPRYAGC